MKATYSKFSLFLLLFHCISTHAEALPTINILSWWGYLNYPEITQAAEAECGVKLSYDEYFSNEEFLRRWGTQKDFYDVIIFSETIYKVIQHNLPQLSSSRLARQALSYHPEIRKHYLENKFPANTVYFVHSLSGFLWNPQNINLNSTDSLISMFHKAAGKYVVIIDDPVEASKLITSSFQNKSLASLSLTHFKEVTQEARVYITNNYSQIYKKPEFAFSFGWSGESVVDLMASHQSYRFLVHPKLSYLTTDLLAQTTDGPKAYCVAKFLTSSRTMAILQNKDFYFSPYLDSSTVSNPTFKTIYQNLMLALPSLEWIDPIDKNEFDRLNHSWQLIKLSLINHHRVI